MEYTFQDNGGLLSSGGDMNLRLGKPTSYKDSTANIGKNLKIVTPAIKFEGCSTTVGGTANFEVNDFYCKDSIIKATDIYLPSAEHVHLTNCNLVGNVHYFSEQAEL